MHTHPNQKQSEKFQFPLQIIHDYSLISFLTSTAWNLVRPVIQILPTCGIRARNRWTSVKNNSSHYSLGLSFLGENNRAANTSCILPAELSTDPRQGDRSSCSSGRTGVGGQQPQATPAHRPPCWLQGKAGAVTPVSQKDPNNVCPGVLIKHPEFSPCFQRQS